MPNVTDLSKVREQKQAEAKAARGPWWKRWFQVDKELEQQRADDAKKGDDFNPWIGA